MLYVLFIFLSVNPYEIDRKYDSAINNAKIAAYKQSGLEEEVTQFTNTTGQKVNKWLKQNNLQTVSTVITFAAPVIVKKEVTFQTNNLMFTGNANKKQLTWTLSF